MKHTQPVNMPNVRLLFEAKKSFFNEILNSSGPNDKLKKAAEEYSSISFSGRQDLYDGFIEGAKFQAERMYTEEEVYQLLYDLSAQVLNNKISTPKLLEKWFEQFKKK